MKWAIAYALFQNTRSNKFIKREEIAHVVIKGLPQNSGPRQFRFL